MKCLHRTARVAGRSVVAIRRIIRRACRPVFEQMEGRTLLSFSAHVNFQPTDRPVPTGYSVDSGAAYGSRGNTGLTYGWDADNTANAFDRWSSLAVDQRYNTFVDMQPSGSSRTWEIAVPNGTYTVHAVAGDANAWNDALHINAEGQTLIDGTSTSGNRWVEGTATVTVTDGKLTISSAADATRDKIDYIDISDASGGSGSTGGTGTTPPPVVPGISIGNVSQPEGNSGTSNAVFTVKLSAATTQAVTVKYATVDGTATAVDKDYQAVSGTLTFAPGVTSQTISVPIVGDTKVEPEESFSVVLSSPGNGTIATGTGTGTIVNDDTAPTGGGNTTFSAHVNFGPSGRPTPAGYVSDAGLVFGDRGNSLSYGWNVDNTANAFDRWSSLAADQRYNTYAELEPWSAPTDSSRVWEIAVPNGTYTVHAVSGDASGWDETYKLMAEGQTLVSGSATSANRWVEGTATVTVTDGKLTISSGAGAYKNNIDYIDITAASGSTGSTGGSAGGTGTTPPPVVPGISIGNVSQPEGNSGTSNAVFTVKLSAATTNTVTVKYATADGTATVADTDYQPVSGTLTFAPGVSSQTISVPIVGDTKVESDETFSVVLSSPGNATIATGTGTGTIVNDDSNTTTTPTPASSAQIGANIDANVDWSAAHVWADAAHDFRWWGQVNAPWNANPSMTFTADGYPIGDADALSYLTNYPTGVYKLSWTGAGNIVIGGMGTMSNVVRNGNTVTADVTIKHDNADGLTGGIITLGVRNTDLNNLVGNIHLWSPGYGPGDIFTKDFLKNVAPFDSMRFLDWCGTNNSPVVTWSDRTQPNAMMQGKVGVALENIIALANAVHRDLWINVPDQASDNYVQQMAQLVKAQLDPGLHVRVEYSNEVWNPTFDQFGRNLAKAKANGALTAADDFGRAAQQYAVRSMQVSKIFQGVFGSNSSQFLMVYGGQNSNPYWVQAGMGYVQQNYGAASQFWKEVAVAPYIGNDLGAAPAGGWTLDSLFTSMTNFSNTTLVQWLKDAKASASQFGMGLDGYESGQALSGVWTLDANLAEAAQSDPRMYQLYLNMEQVWKSIGGGLLNLFSHVGLGGWSLLENPTSMGSRKWDAAMDMLLPAGDATLDGKVGYNDFLILKADYGKTGMWWEQGDFNGDNVVNKADLMLMLPNLTGLTAAQQADVNAFMASA